MNIHIMIFIQFIVAKGYCCLCNFPEPISEAYDFAHYIFTGSIVKVEMYKIEDTCAVHKYKFLYTKYISEITFKVDEIFRGKLNDSVTFLYCNIQKYDHTSPDNLMIPAPDQMVTDSGLFLVFAKTRNGYEASDSCDNIPGKLNLSHRNCCVGTLINNEKIQNAINDLRNASHHFQMNPDFDFTLKGFFRHKKVEEIDAEMKKLQEELEKSE